ncbi:MAG: sigma-70 family RNA polymerase sigma factor [Gemmataceae bacterium]
MILPSTHASLFLPGRGNDGSGAERWQAFHGRYHAVILVWCRRRGLSPACAEDLTQEIWLKLLRLMHKYDAAKGRFRSWLKAVVNNALTDYWRRNARQPERGGVGGTAFLDRVAAVAGPEAADELSVAIADRAGTVAAEALARVRARLQETTWQAFYQTLVEKRPAQDVARDLGLSVSSVYKNTYRVKQMLEEEFSHVHANHEDVLPECDHPATLPG